MLKTLRSRKGFTLIELMIVVVIIGILAALAIPRFSAASDRAKEKEADGILKQVYTMQEVWKAQHGDFTDEVTDLIQVGFEAPTTLKHYVWDGDVELPLCLEAGIDGAEADVSHKDRCINVDGVITSDTPAAPQAAPAEPA